MPLTSLDVDDAINEGAADGQKLSEEAMREFYAPYIKAQKEGAWLALLEQAVPGESGRAIEAHLRQRNPEQYEQVKKEIMDAMNLEQPMIGGPQWPG